MGEKSYMNYTTHKTMQIPVLHSSFKIVMRQTYIYCTFTAWETSQSSCSALVTRYIVDMHSCIVSIYKAK